MLTQKEWLEELRAQLESHPNLPIIFFFDSRPVEINDVHFDHDIETEDTIRVYLERA